MAYILKERTLASEENIIKFAMEDSKQNLLARKANIQFISYE